MFRWRSIVVVTVLAAPGPAADAVPAPEDLFVPMRDGVRLHAQLYHPGGDGPAPVVLVRSPYRLPDQLSWDAERLARSGFALVYQNTRGRFRSQGDPTVFLSDGRPTPHPDRDPPLADGYDTIEWIAAQPWCDGRVGTWGASAPGITQLLAAAATPPSLVCQHVGIATGDVFLDGLFQGGAYRRSLVDSWLQANDFDVDRHRRIYTAHPADDPFWDTITLNRAPGPVHAPVLLWGGWYDCFIQGTVDAFIHLRRISPPGVADQHRLIIGPWPHGIAREHGDASFPEEALLPPGIDALAWFERHIPDRTATDHGGHHAPDETTPAVVYWVMGPQDAPDGPGNEWRTDSDWPPPAAREAALCLVGERLQPAPPAHAGSRSFRYDPDNPVPTRGGANLHLDKGCFDQRPVENRPDVLLFTSPPLDRPVEVTGAVVADLFVRSTAPITDFTARLTDVYPDGRSLLVVDGIRRADPVPSGDQETAAVRIDIGPTSLVFDRGHRIRLAISSSNFPRFDANPNTGARFSDDADGPPPVAATNTVAWSPHQPPVLRLPVVGDPLAFADPAERTGRP